MLWPLTFIRWAVKGLWAMTRPWQQWFDPKGFLWFAEKQCVVIWTSVWVRLSLMRSEVKALQPSPLTSCFLFGCPGMCLSPPHFTHTNTHFLSQQEPLPVPSAWRWPAPELSIRAAETAQRWSVLVAADRKWQQALPVCLFFLIIWRFNNKSGQNFTHWTPKLWSRVHALLWLAGLTLGNRWSSTPGRSPSSQRRRSSPPVSHNPTRPDTPPQCKPPPLPLPCSSSRRPAHRSRRLRPRHTPNSRPRLSTWRASRRRGRPGGSERNSL